MMYAKLSVSIEVDISEDKGSGRGTADLCFPLRT
jgi:hypothetical protein